MVRLRLLRLALWPAPVLPAAAACDGACAQEAQRLSRKAEFAY